MSKYFPTSVDPTYPDASLAINLAGVYMVKVGLHDHSQAATTGLQHRLKFWTIDRVARMKMGNEKCGGQRDAVVDMGAKAKESRAGKTCPKGNSAECATGITPPPCTPVPIPRGSSAS